MYNSGAIFPENSDIAGAASSQTSNSRWQENDTWKAKKENINIPFKYSHNIFIPRPTNFWTSIEKFEDILFIDEFILFYNVPTPGSYKGVVKEIHIDDTVLIIFHHGF